MFIQPYIPHSTLWKRLGDVAGLVMHMIGSLPQLKPKSKQLKQLLRLKNNTSRLQYQTEVGYESCYTTEKFWIGRISLS